jgi:hypothetical protein
MIKIQTLLFEGMRIMRGQKNEYFKASLHVLVDTPRLLRKLPGFADIRT